MENWHCTNMDDSLSLAVADELVSVKRSILDAVVVQQQKRIMELEEKLRKSRQEILCLQKERDMEIDVKGWTSKEHEMTLQPSPPHPNSQKERVQLAQVQEPSLQLPNVPMRPVQQNVRGASNNTNPSIPPIPVHVLKHTPKTANSCTPNLPRKRSLGNMSTDRKSKSDALHTPE